MCAVPQNPWGLSRRQVLARLLSGWVYCVLKRAGQLCKDLVSFPEPSSYPIWYQITNNKKTGLQDTGCSGLPRVCWQWDRVGAALWGYNTSRDCRRTVGKPTQTSQVLVIHAACRMPTWSFCPAEAPLFFTVCWHGFNRRMSFRWGLAWELHVWNHNGWREIQTWLSYFLGEHCKH